MKNQKKPLNLEIEISNFWKWAKTTPKEYAQNRGFVERESDYPNWGNLNIALDKAINELDKIYQKEKAELLIQGLAIDNESELTLEKIKENLKDKNIFIEQVINSNQPQTKWQIAELLGNNRIVNTVQYLKKLTEDNDKYVKRRALLSLNSISKEEAKLIAINYIKNSDEYLKIVSNKIINEEINE